MFAPPSLPSPTGESPFKAMARRMVPPPRRPGMPPSPVRQPQVQAQGAPPAPPILRAAPPPALPVAAGGLPQTGGGLMAPPPPPPGPPPGPGGMPGTGGPLMAPPPAATASSADVNLGPNFDAERARRLLMARRQYGPGSSGAFQP